MIVPGLEAADESFVRAVGETPSVPHVYVHVPFCARKCPYCDFNSHAGRDDEADVYVDALLEEARRRIVGRGVRTVFVGGGTPTQLPARTLERLLLGLREVVGDGLEEWTVEANPGSADDTKIGVLAACGVDRVSLGAQSFDARHLLSLGRIHDPGDIRRSVDRVRRSGVPHLSMDLILALPGQTLAEQERDLASVLALEPDHVSAYVLTFEAGTVFTRRMEAGRMAAPDADRELLHLHQAVERLEAARYARYEISNFAREGRVSRHNLGYWRDADWIGLGAGAHSHVGARRWKNVDDPAGYVERLGSRGHAVTWVEWAPPEVAVFEKLMMGLRLLEGVDLDDIQARTGLDARRRHTGPIRSHVRQGLLVLHGARLRATPSGLDVLARVLEDFVPDEETITHEYP